MFVNLLQRDTMGLAEQGQIPDWSWGHRASVGERVLADLVVQDLLPPAPPRPRPRQSWKWYQPKVWGQTPWSKFWWCHAGLQQTVTSILSPIKSHTYLTHD